MATENVNGVNRVSDQIPDFTTLMFKKDLMEASKAIHDSTQMEIKALVKNLEREVLISLGKHIEKMVEEKVSSSLSQIKSENELTIKAYQDGLANMTALFAKGISVNVGEKAIQIHQVPSVVNVSIPAEAIELKAMPAPVVNVSVPSDSILVKMGEVNFTAPAITNQVNVPDIKMVVPENAIEHKTIVNIEEKAFDIKLHQPAKKQKVVEKSIIYSETTGRPEKIREVIEE